MVAGRWAPEITGHDNLSPTYILSRHSPSTVWVAMLLQNGYLRCLIGTIRSEDRGVSEAVGVLLMLVLTIVVSGIIGLFALWVEG